ncbi:hypothetical protein BN14_05252 [Rhizoctonia solani AG-1 IB]|uniref:PNPLA domain-containing protein n=1 Tax=Thanatephorus cucumeris (strain AG1-IB / isolate 7/3/14) TaxID=1108050 RepID=M5BVE6_THACB|nr:hypothetical protein BN14_05252 [Rhizoctonia solani AG-1 IB]
MNRIQGLEDYDGHGKPAKPSDWFDIIAGTGTGGLIACMLGKLQMPIEEAIKEYKKLTEEVFSRKKMIGENAYRGDSLEKALQSMIERTTGNKDKKMMEDISYTNDTKTIIFAMLGHNMNACRPVMFRSYFAIYASMAHPEFFKSITITEDSVNYSFIGGELGNSNPLAYVLGEVRDLHPDHYVSCIMSIAAIAIRNMAYDSERVAEEMAKRFQDVTDVYFRFNVDQGLQDIEADSWEKLSNVAEHTKAYLNTFEINQTMNKAVTAVFSRSAALAVTYIAPTNSEDVSYMALVEQGRVN